jgi:hypothetical protein
MPSATAKSSQPVTRSATGGRSRRRLVEHARRERL